MHSRPAHISQMPYQSTRTTLRRHLCAKQPSGWRQNATIIAATPSAVIQWMRTLLPEQWWFTCAQHKYDHTQAATGSKLHIVKDSLGRCCRTTVLHPGCQRTCQKKTFRRSNLSRSLSTRVLSRRPFWCHNSRLVEPPTRCRWHRLALTLFSCIRYNILSDLAGSYNRAI